jgi:hypothetical protein
VLTWRYPRRAPSIWGTGFPFLLKHGPKVLDRAHGCGSGQRLPTDHANGSRRECAQKERGCDDVRCGVFDGGAQGGNDMPNSDAPFRVEAACREKGRRAAAEASPRQEPMELVPSRLINPTTHAGDGRLKGRSRQTEERNRFETGMESGSEGVVVFGLFVDVVTPGVMRGAFY